MPSALELLFLGTGTSAGIPMIGCHCPVCSSTDPHDKRTRPSIVLSYDSARILVDTSPELRLQCVANTIDKIDAVVFTHAHADHIMGLDDVRRFNFLSKGPLDIWADPETMSTLQRCFGYAFQGPSADMKIFRPHLVPRLINGPFNLFGKIWNPIPLVHGDVNVLGFRIDNFAYCTDVNFIPDKSWDLLHGLDVLVLDALQYRPHATHFSVDEALAAAEKIGAKQTYFTHIAHALGHETTNAKLPPNVRLAHDGLRVQI